MAVSAAGIMIMPESYIAKQFLGGFYAFFLLSLSSALDKERMERLSCYRMFAIGIILGAFWEILGYLFGLWYYPFVIAHIWSAFLLPFFWGMYMMVIVHSFHIVARFTKRFSVALFAVTTLLFVMLEGINLLTESWVYTGWFLEWAMTYAACFPLVLSFEATAKFSTTRGRRLAW